jgi:hypothetical protein
VIPTKPKVMGVVVRHSNASFQPFKRAITTQPTAIVKLYTNVDTLSPMPSSNFMTSLQKKSQLLILNKQNKNKEKKIE